MTIIGIIISSSQTTVTAGCGITMQLFMDIELLDNLNNKSIENVGLSYDFGSILVYQ